MSLSASRRIFRPAESEDDVFVVGETVRRHVAADDPVTTVTNLLGGAKRRAETELAAAHDEATAIVARAEAEASAIREAARAAGFQEGLRAGSTDAEGAAAGHLAILRAAAGEGLTIRDAMIDEAMPAIARAVAMACRRVVGAAFEADPGLTADACADAVRMTAGQQIISIRVSPDVLDSVRARLVDVADYVRPDDGVGLGGCVIDLRNGTIDATLDARLELMELALRAAGGADA